MEFKVRVPSKVRELTEEIYAFANADGGYLLIGVDDNGKTIVTTLENDGQLFKVQSVKFHRLSTVKCMLQTQDVFFSRESHRDYYEQGATITIGMKKN